MQATCPLSQKREDFDDFIVKQITTSCLSQFSYYIESGKEAIVIDPIREPDQYLTLLKERGATLKYIFETHFHADFVSGHVELYKQTGAQIVFGPNAKPEYTYHQAKDEEVLTFGKVQVKVLHTPGHTMESSSFLITDSNGKQRCVFTGDTLFLGEVGRPDLAVKAANVKETDLAEMLYNSIHNKIKPLDNDVIVFPGHGAGSACGKKISSGGSDTLEHQKKTNYVFNENLKKEEFIELLTSNLPSPPLYFFYDVMCNKIGYEQIDTILEKTMKPLSVENVKQLSVDDPKIVILDSRDVDVVTKGFVPRSIGVTLKATYAILVGTLFKPETKFIIVCESGKERESILRLCRIGYDNVIGYLDGGFKSWVDANEPIETLDNPDVNEIYEDLIKDNKTIIDVREKGEWENTGVIPNCILSALNSFESNLDNIPEKNDLFIICNSGRRSVIAATLLKRLGYKNHITNLNYGIGKLVENGRKLEPYNSSKN